MNEKITPMMAQYKAVKEKYKDCMVLFRLGDFYEMFFEDAVNGSKILGIALTARNKGDGLKAPMCGVPYHAASSYIAKLTRAGKKVAVCDQMTEPDGRSLVEREVVRVITPGTTLDDNILDKKSNNYVAALAQSYDGYGFAYCDVTTGEFFVTGFNGLDEVFAEVLRIGPAEIIMTESLLNGEAVKNVLRCMSGVAAFSFELIRDPIGILTDNFGIKALAVFGLEDKKNCVLAGATLYEYLKETQKADLKHIESIKFYSTSDFMVLSPSTIKNLEIFPGLFSVIDKTKTAMGGRKLKKWMINPLREKDGIIERLDAISSLLARPAELKSLREILGEILDIERILSRLAIGTGNARDLVAMKASLKIIPRVKEILNEFSAVGVLGDSVNGLVDMSGLVGAIESAIKDEPLALVREGGMIRDGYNSELDSLRGLSTEGKTFISEMQKREIERTGIGSLKIKYNKVFGYYIEISNSNLGRAPSDYIRKQTLVNAERFITPELKEYEEKVLNSMERICEIEFEIFQEIRGKVVERARDIRSIADAIAVIDIIAGFAETAIVCDYCRPEILSDDGIIEVRGGRHPIVESLSLSRDFVPNDCVIDPAVNILTLITGPNMGGKSVYIKQVALIAYMAHIGCYVPAATCRLGLVDQIFTRVGASDNLARGESTFMVEMIEAARILHSATERSLVILDEIGRGTSTYDGVSIAWAICEYIHDHIKAKTLFATHYHELIGLVEGMKRGLNLSIAVSEKVGASGHSELVFLYKIIEGGTSRSYGIEVARLAGLPKEVLMRARGVLEKLENKTIDTGKAVNEDQIEMFEEREHKTLTELKGLDPNNMTPLDALKKLHELKEKGII